MSFLLSRAQAVHNRLGLFTALRISIGGVKNLPIVILPTNTPKIKFIWVCVAISFLATVNSEFSERQRQRQRERERVGREERETNFFFFYII